MCIYYQFFSYFSCSNEQNNWFLSLFSNFNYFKCNQHYAHWDHHQKHLQWAVSDFYNCTLLIQPLSILSALVIAHIYIAFVIACTLLASVNQSVLHVCIWMSSFYCLQQARSTPPCPDIWLCPHIHVTVAMYTSNELTILHHPWK